MLANYEHAGLRLRRARSDPFPLELHGTWHVAHAFSLLLSRDHAVSRRGREMRASILDQPPIAVAGGHVDKVDRYHGDDRSIRTVNIAYSKERVDNRNIRLDEADPVVGERRLCGAVDGLRLGTKVLHHGDPSWHVVTLWGHEGSIFGKQGCSEFGILLKEGLSKAISECANGCFILSLAGTHGAGRSDAERPCETR